MNMGNVCKIAAVIMLILFLIIGLIAENLLLFFYAAVLFLLFFAIGEIIEQLRSINANTYHTYRLLEKHFSQNENE